MGQQTSNAHLPALQALALLVTAFTPAVQAATSAAALNELKPDTSGAASQHQLPLTIVTTADGWRSIKADGVIPAAAAPPMARTRGAHTTASRVYPAADAHAPSCEPKRNSCERIRFVVQGGGSAADANLIFTGSPQAQVSAIVNGHSASIVNASNHPVHLRHGTNTILYTFSEPVSIRGLRIDLRIDQLQQQDHTHDADFVTYEAEDVTCTGAVIGHGWASELESSRSTTPELTPLHSSIVSESSQARLVAIPRLGLYGAHS